MFYTFMQDVGYLKLQFYFDIERLVMDQWSFRGKLEILREIVQEKKFQFLRQESKYYRESG